MWCPVMPEGWIRQATLPRSKRAVPLRWFSDLKGLDAARDCAAQLARAGVNVVSGYARGVDTASHIAALEAGGTTTLVLATGLAGWWKKNDIAAVWDWNRVLVVSEFELNDPWTPARAFQRNGTICRLSRAVIVAEAARISGTMNTVRQLPEAEDSAIRRGVRQHGGLRPKVTPRPSVWALSRFSRADRKS